MLSNEVLCISNVEGIERLMQTILILRESRNKTTADSRRSVQQQQGRVAMCSEETDHLLQSSKVLASGVIKDKFIIDTHALDLWAEKGQHIQVHSPSALIFRWK